MLSDRPYMRGDYRRETTPVSTWLICAIAGAFAIEFITGSHLPPPWTGLTSDFALSIDGLESGRLWTPLTFWLLHSTSNLFHVGLVLGGLFLLGRELVGILGSRRFVALFGASLLTGALVWTAVNWRTGGELIGATAGVYGLVAVHALLYPNREASFLLFFAIPVTFRPKQLAVGLLLTDIFALILIDILGRPLPFAYAPSAHLGGMFAGWIYYQFFHESEWRIRRASHALSRRLPHVTPSPELSPANPGKPADSTRRSPTDIRAEVDRVLDKINSHGLGALTPDERRILDDAKALLSRR